MAVVLRLDNVTVERGGRRVLRSQSISVSEGERVYIHGENGSGKSTLLETMLGLIPKTNGDRFWRDMMTSPLNAGAFRTGEVAYLPQYSNLFPSLSVRENILLGAPESERQLRKRRLEDLAETFPLLEEILGRKASETSVGESQITAVSRVLVRRPKVLFLDEPTAGVASDLLVSVYTKIMECIEGATLVFTEQHSSLARRYCTREKRLA